MIRWSVSDGQETGSLVGISVINIDNLVLPYCSSIALVGGDGLYHEAVNGLQQRLMKEAGLDENDSSASLQPVPIPVGLIPAGNINDNDWLFCR